MPLLKALAKNMAPMTNADESPTNRLTLFPIYLSLFVVSTLCPDPLGRGTKGSGIIHLFSPQILEIRYYCACAKSFKMEDMRTEIDTIF